MGRRNVLTATAAKSQATLVDQPRTLVDLVEALGDIPLARILVDPAPGTATEADVLVAEHRYDRLYELVDGVLVEKGMGFTESLIAVVFIKLLDDFTVRGNIGVVTAPDGTMRLFAGLVRIPDVAFISWDRLPGRRLPKEPIPSLAPDLAVEVLSVSNTLAEMTRKRREYFAAGVRLIWEVDPRERLVYVYTPDGSTTKLGDGQILDGGTVLPGFSVAISDIFAALDRHG